MADLADVETAILALVGDALRGEAFRAFRGWPTPAALEADLREGLSYVTVIPRESVGQVTTRHLSQTSILPAVPVTLHPVNSSPARGNVVGFTGVAATRHVAGVGVYDRTGIPNAAYCVACEPGETAVQVAARIAGQIPGAVLDGASITVPEAYLEARTDSHAETSRELRRQDHGFQVEVLCPTPEIRDAIGRKVDLALAMAEDREWISLPGGEAGWYRGGGSFPSDKGSANLAWRRTFLCQVEYPTTLTSEAPRLLFGGLSTKLATVQAGVAKLVLV